MTSLLRQLVQFALMGLLIMISAATAAQAGAPFSNTCETRFGVCHVQIEAPIGSPCYCGDDQGSIVYPRQNTPRRDPRLSDVCATRYGICYGGPELPIGSSCLCGREPGRIIERDRGKADW